MSSNEEMKQMIADVIEQLAKAPSYEQIEQLSVLYGHVTVYIAFMQMYETRIKSVNKPFQAVDVFDNVVTVDIQSSLNMSVLFEHYLRLQVSKQARGRNDLVNVLNSYFRTNYDFNNQKQMSVVGQAFREDGLNTPDKKSRNPFSRNKNKDMNTNEG